MIIQTLPSGPLETNTYVVACPKTRQAAVVDPASESSDSVTEFVTKNQLIPSKILLTHSHWDHIADVKTLKSKYKIPVYIHSLDAPNLENPGSDGIPTWLNIPGVIPDVRIKENDIIPVGDLKFQVLHTPGHTPGGVCFYCAEEGILFAGDTLFKGSIGNLSLPTSESGLMWDSLAKLAQLPPQTRVYPGHGPSTSIGAESWLKNAKNIFEI